jgi:hypothetical protein
MFDILFRVYLVNMVLLIVHEIDSAYWKEWELFRIPGGITTFLILHVPLVFLFIYGWHLVYRETTAGLMISLALGLAGIFAFSIHTFFIRKGRSEFKTAVSLLILAATLAASMVQTGITLYLMVA